MQSTHIHSIFPFKCKQTFINNHLGNLGIVLSKLLPALGLAKYHCGGIYGNLSGDLGPSNHISLEEIHRFSSSV